MCGIAGILSTRNSNLNILSDRIKKILKHRGPDDDGIYISSDQSISLIHTRLSILDTTTSGHQPMSTPDGRYWITFNGEIYNFKALRSQLEFQGERFQSKTDTEVILKLYQKQGRDCIHALRGMFAFAIWDEKEQTCFLARDPLGIKPLYYWRSSSTLLFASEIRAILATGLPSKQLSLDGLYGYLTTGSVPEPSTLVENISILEAGHWLYWQVGQIQKYQYWQPDFTPHPLAISEAISTVREALIDSIQHHFVSDVPVGVFLSGGIDSSSIVALARQINTGELKTYSIAFNETAYNEGKIAQKLASHFSTEHTQYKITASQARSFIPKFLASIDQPTIDGFNVFCVSQLAHESGTKVVLSGLGGDELFAGYPSFQRIPKLIYLKKLLNMIKPLSFTIRKYLQYWGKTSKQRRIYDFLCNPTTSAATAYQLQRGIFSHQETCFLLQHYLSDQFLFKLPNNSVLLPKLPTLLDEVSWIEISCYMRNQLLRDSDVMSMAWGLELRVPFVDSVLLSTLIKIPSNLRLSLKKQLLIQAIPELPAWVTKRPKKAFTFPFEQWLEHDWKNDLPPIPHIPNVSLKPWYRYWSLVVLEAWLDLFFS